MRLKKLELFGFKSFADKSVFEFEGSITGLVGPNGSGKSNIVDALKWVLGEQSAKKLRGNEMADMIFNGSDARRASGSAKVRVTLENDRGVLPVDYDEVCIERQCYRSGESEYSINGQSCRLKDIRDMLMDTGVGVSAYSFIEQGQVDRLLQSSSKERREVFEEAAGINKYLLRKKEAERKLEKVRSNLQRVTDIIEELERQLRSVKRQASKARRYKRYADDLRTLRLAAGIHKQRRMALQIRRLEETLKNQERRLSNLRNEARNIEDEVRREEKGLEGLQQEVDLTRDELSRLNVREQTQVKSVEVNQERREELQGRLSDLSQRHDEVRESLADLRQELTDSRQQWQRGEAELRNKKAEFREKEAAIGSLKRECSRLQEKVESVKQAGFELMQQESRTQNQIRMLASELETLQKRLQRQEDRERNICENSDRIGAERDAERTELEDVQKRLDIVKGELKATENELSGATSQMESLSSTIGELKAELRGKLSRKQLLEDLQARAEGVKTGVKVLLEASSDSNSVLKDVPGLLANHLDVSSDDAPAVEAALDQRSQIFVVDGKEQACSALEILRKAESGRAEVLDLSSMREMVPACDSDARHGEWLIDLVDYPDRLAPAVHYLLARCVVVDNAEQALGLLDGGLPEDIRVVTREGDSFVRGGIWAAGGPESGNLISRRSELAELEEEVDQASRQLDRLSEKGDQCSDRIQSLQRRKSDLSDRRERLVGEKNEKLNRLSILETKLQQRDEELQMVRSEIDVLKKDIEEGMEQLEEEKGELEALRVRKAGNESELQQCQGEAAEKQAILDEKNRQINEFRNEIGRLEEQQKSRDALVERCKKEVESGEEELKRVDGEKDVTGRQLEKISGQIAESRKQLEDIRGQREEVERKLESKRADYSRRKEHIGGLKRELGDYEEKISDAEDGVQKSRMELNELRLKDENLRERVAEEDGVHLMAFLRPPEEWCHNAPFVNMDIEEFANEGAERRERAVAEWYRRVNEEDAAEDGEGEGPRKSIALEEATRLREDVLQIADSEDTDWSEIEGKIRELRGKIDRMGGANLDAIKEQDELESRAEFLANQKEDLEKARGHELAIIRKLSKKSRENFLDTFESVRQNFQILIRKLFGGGSGDLFLQTEEEEDVLEAGIGISVRPPGKDTKSISLLSGGEKALSAVALLFAIFEARPSPFCLLDEVDAPLDEANVGRFLGLLEDYRESTQFVVVTHNKVTMSAAETLHGISLQEDGVSKQVAINFEEIDRRLREMRSETTRAKAG
jgi:chromosome segregation protein